MTFLTVITRHIPSRNELLKRNVMSLDTQDDQDYQHMLIIDNDGHGVAWANGMLATYDWSRISGEYVLILDDDDELAAPYVITWLRQAAAGKPDCIVLQMDHGAFGVLPTVRDFGIVPPSGRIGVSAVIPRRALFLEAVKQFEHRYAGDYGYIKACIQGSKKTAWLQMIATRANQIGSRTGV